MLLHYVCSTNLNNGMHNGMLANWKSCQKRMNLSNWLKSTGSLESSPSFWMQHFKRSVKPRQTRLTGMTDGNIKSWKCQIRRLLQANSASRVYLNERLFKFNIVESPLCSLCNQASESVLHLFCTCTKTCNLWRQLCTWLADQNIMLTSNLEPQTAILGL